MENLIDILKQPEVLAAIITSIVGTFFSVKFYYSDNNKELARERLEKVFFPIFKKLDKHFFKLDSNDKHFIAAIESVKEIIEAHELIAGNDLCYFFEVFSKEKDSRSFDELCNYILNEQDRLLLKVGLPAISGYYRLDHRMFDKKGFIIFCTKHALRFIIIPGLIAIDILIVMQIILK